MMKIIADLTRISSGQAARKMSQEFSSADYLLITPSQSENLDTNKTTAQLLVVSTKQPDDNPGASGEGRSGAIACYEIEEVGLEFAAALTPMEAAVRVEVRDKKSLDVACALARMPIIVLINFTDPTKIPLEIVIAAAENSSGVVGCYVTDSIDSTVTRYVLEKGPGAIVVPIGPNGTPTSISDYRTDVSKKLALTEFTVRSIAHTGVGERACVDTCSLLEKNEGMLNWSICKVVDVVRFRNPPPPLYGHAPI